MPDDPIQDRDASLDPRRGRGYAAHLPPQSRGEPHQPAPSQARAVHLENAGRRAEEKAARAALRAETKPPSDQSPAITPETRRTALDAGSDLDGRSRALARRPSRGTDTGSQEGRLKEVEKRLETQGGRNVRVDKQLITHRPDGQLPEININIVWNGQPSVIAVRARQIS